jgi:hypothetical protein
VIARSEGLAGATMRAASLLAQAVRNQANVLSYRDGFEIVSLVAVAMLIVTALLRSPPPVVTATQPADDGR